MDNPNESSEVETKNITLKAVLSWIVGVLFIITALSLFSSSGIAGFAMLLAALVILPPVSKFIKNKYNYSFSRKLKVVAVIVLLIIAGANMDSAPASSLSVVADNDESQKTLPSNPPSIGEAGFLRVPNTSDPDQVVCLGKTKEDYEQITKAFLAKDYLGILEIPGAFCIGNGAKVQVIDTGFGIRRVRITEGLRDIDQDKTGASGWTAMEFVAKN